MQTKLKLKKGDGNSAVDATEYRSLVGSLRYLTHTRPDIGFGVDYVSRYMEEPHEEHLAAVKHILMFIVGSSNLGVFYPRKTEGQDELVGFSDSDLAGLLDERKSTSGINFFLGRSPISWQSIKQRVVVQSSCEAEYIAASTGACQAIWLARLLSEIKDAGARVHMLKIDNKSVISLIRNPIHRDRLNHIDIKYHVLQEYESTRQIQIESIRTEDQL
jgi:hypothetical protein